jgi:tRNA uridine 5-carboxymethylaminomethyl modification enzyme
VARLKTGTPPRLHARSIRWDQLDVQKGDHPPKPMSLFTPFIQRPQLTCAIAYTNTSTHDVIRGNLDRSPLYSGKIKSLGPRYCPSIEDKVVKFPAKERHQIFLEPEGRETQEIYVNGLSTSLPEDVQRDIIHSIAGLETAEIVRAGYAIEYDFSDPLGLTSSLQSKFIPGLFMAGQINGTTGYEEAAAQGFIAGINAARYVKSESPIVFSRDSSYIGVMVDDLVTRGVDEPYRMFTARAEYRMSLRSDNADLRLLETGFELGLISQKVYDSFCRYRDLVHGNGESIDAELSPWTMSQVHEQREILKSYRGYIQRENALAVRLNESESYVIPDEIDYSALQALGHEARQKLSRVRPRTIGQARRIPGLTPADLQILWTRASSLKT